MNKMIINMNKMIIKKHENILLNLIQLIISNQHKLIFITNIMNVKNNQIRILKNNLD
jgi:hypothetical protein